jgi:prepilin-type N-terminal cleavage/methylation domain-containing protein
MKLDFKRVHAGDAAFSMIEVVVALAIFGIVFLSLYSSMSSGFAVVRLSRENLRATQIMEEKMETIRLYTWAQVTSNGFVPTNFTEVFYKMTNASSTGLVSGAGITYTGTVSIVSAPVTEAYSNDLKQITVTLKWLSDRTPRQRDMTTFVSKYGVQNYVYY